MTQFNYFCEDNNIKCYVIVVPDKNDVYLSKKSHILNNKAHEKLQTDFIDKCKDRGVKIVYPYNEMLKAKDSDFVYFKTEHHWTDFGAYLGYSELMKLIKKDFPSVRVQTPQDYTYFNNNLVKGDFDRKFHSGTTCNTLCFSKTLSKKFHNTPYRYWKHKNFDKLKVEKRYIPLHMDKTYFYPYGADKRVVLLGTSQSENLCEFVPFTFKNVYRLRNNNVEGVSSSDWFKIMKYYKNAILSYKPDILIFCITTENIKKIHDIFNME